MLGAGIHIAAGGEKSVGSAFEEKCLIQAGLWSLVSFSLVLAGLLSYRGHFNFLFLVMRPAPSLEGGVAEGINNMGGFPVSSL